MTTANRWGRVLGCLTAALVVVGCGGGTDGPQAGAPTQTSQPTETTQPTSPPPTADDAGTTSDQGASAGVAPGELSGELIIGSPSTDQFARAVEALEEQHPDLTVTVESNLANNPAAACDQADAVVSFQPPDGSPCELQSEEAGHATVYYVEETPAVRAYIDALVEASG